MFIYAIIYTGDMINTLLVYMIKYIVYDTGYAIINC